MTRANTPTYKTLNWPSCNEALKRRRSLAIWFDPDMSWAAKPQKAITARCGRAQRGPAGLEIPRRRALATMEWLPPQKPRRTKIQCVKLLGQRLMVRDFDRQVAGFKVHVAVLNGFTALGIPVTEVVG
jgi:hypothetical protein